MTRNSLPKINSIWRASDHVRFTVNSLIESEHGVVVHYTRNTDGNTFYCLVDAFTQRFTLDIE
jgi:hypothetical protein